MPKYAQACGLLDEKNKPTLFGYRVHRHDPLMEMTGTQWLMHYCLSVEHGPGPAFWSHLVETFFHDGQTVRDSDVIAELSAFVEKSEGRTIASGDAKSTVNAFVNTYSDREDTGLAAGGESITSGLAVLGFFERNGKDVHRVLEPDPPSVWAFGIALLDYWQAHYAGRAGIHLDDLSADRGLGPLFMMGPGRINAYLRDLQDEGYVEIYRVAPPYRLMLLRQDPEPLWQKLYASNTAD
jgi:hypothetical protein